MPRKEGRASGWQLLPASLTVLLAVGVEVVYSDNLCDNQTSFPEVGWSVVLGRTNNERIYVISTCAVCKIVRQFISEL